MASCCDEEQRILPLGPWRSDICLVSLIAHSIVSSGSNPQRENPFLDRFTLSCLLFILTVTSVRIDRQSEIRQDAEEEVDFSSIKDSRSANFGWTVQREKVSPQRHRRWWIEEAFCWLSKGKLK